MPNIVWRAGIDLNPIDISDARSREWLQTLIWPGQEFRIDRLARAAEIVAAHPPLLIKGDLLDKLDDAVAQAPADATLVIFHSAVLVYLPAERRQTFMTQVSQKDAVWLSNEGPNAFPDIAARVPPGVDVSGMFMLARNGIPVALTRPHGQARYPLHVPS